MKIIKCHLISRVLIKQFCQKSKTNVYNLRQNQWTGKKSPTEIAFVPFSEEIILKSEKRWNNLVEKKYQNVVNDLISGSFFSKKENIILIKSLIALHFTRSISFLYLFVKHEEKALNEFLSEIAMIKNLNQEDAMRRWKQSMGKLLPKLIDEQMDKVQKYIFGYNLEIAISPTHTNFILGDSPVVNISTDGRIGPTRGVALMDSIGLFMPLTPRHVASLNINSIKNEYIRLSTENVQELNRKTRLNCFREFYSI